jgi:F-type H+-transporting ATPase subunit a
MTNDCQEHDASGTQESKPDSHASQELPAEALPSEHPAGDQSSAGHDQAPEPISMQGALEHFLDSDHLFEHVMDSDHIEMPKFLGGSWAIPNPLGYTKDDPMTQLKIGQKPVFVGQFTKFMAIELVAAVILAVVFIRLARRSKSAGQPRGRIANALEATVVFIRDEIAKPAIGSKDMNRFLPFLLTMFFFILFLNLIGLLPWFGSVTGSISVTAVLALCTFLVVIGSGIRKMGFVPFLKAQVPHMDLPRAMAIFLIPLIWCIEMINLLVKHFVLAIRLFANMFGGHLVLAAFLGFIGVGAAAGVLGWGIGIGSVGMSVLFCVLELLVAFLQAYIFTFLAALFIGAALHAH